MKVFQIIGGEVTIINESICYMDTTENFKTDSGLTDLPEMVVYDNKQKCCVVDNLFYIYPDAKYDGYISQVKTYVGAKEKREYVPPAEPTSDDQKEAITADYNSGVEELDQVLQHRCSEGRYGSPGKHQAGF